MKVYKLVGDNCELCENYKLGDNYKYKYMADISHRIYVYKFIFEINLYNLVHNN